MSELVDENAFGLLVSFYDVESAEYGLEPAEFAACSRAFCETLRERLASLPLELEARAVDFGHALFVEYAEPESPWDAIGWLREARARLAERELRSIGVISHGSRWRPEQSDDLEDRTLWIGTVPVLRAAHMSEPLRRALYADAAAQPGDDGAQHWGPGLYLDTEALEALGRKLKNAPTPLCAASATFYRLSR